MKFNHIKRLPEEAVQWLEKNQLQPMVKTFVGNGATATERTQRKWAVVFSIAWYQSYLHGKNGRDISPELYTLILNHAAPESDESEEDRQDRIQSFWTDTCGHVAAYNFAGIEPQHRFYAALYALLKTQAGEEISIDPVDGMIDAAIRDGYKAFYGYVSDRITYGVRLNGLDSQLIFIPAAANNWTEHADMLLQQFTPSAS